MELTKKQFIINHLIENGSITRNFALSNYISRLGAVICDLNNNGWVIEGKYIEVNTIWGKRRDYKYFVIKIGEKNDK